MISRRTLLKSAATVPTLAVLKGRGVLARGIVSNTSFHNGVWASTGDGNTYGMIPGNPGISGLPSSSPYITFVGHVTGGCTGPLIAQSLATPSPSWGVSFLSNGTKRNPQYAIQTFAETNPGGPNNIGPNVITPYGAWPSNGGAYHGLAISIDGTQPLSNMITIMVDRVQISLNQIGSGGPWAFPYYQTPSGAVLNWYLLSSPSFISMPKFIGSFSELKVFVGTPIDLTDPSVMDSFFAANGGPLPFNEIYGNGYNKYLDLTPQIYISGGKYLSPQAQRPAMNIVGGQYVPPANDPNTFELISGAWKTANVDPWGFVGS